MKTGGEAPATAGTRALAVVVLAGGRGKRMRSSTPKHLVALLGRRMVEWVIDAARALDPERVVVVVSPGAGDALSGVELAVQEDARGTGHAVAAARPLLDSFEGDLLVLAGDTPLVTPDLLGALVDEHRRQRAAATVLTFESPLPLPYGRVLRDAAGRVVSIVEELDAMPDERSVRELNASVYVFEPAPLWDALDRLEETATRGELRLPHAIRRIAAAGETVATFDAPDPEEVRGVNTPEDLADVETVLRARMGVRAWPESVIATHSGLRGRLTADLTPEVVRHAVEGLVALVRRRGCPLVIGVAHDDRPGGGPLAADVATYATGAGADVVEFGAVSTPAAKLAARRRGLGGAIVVTGSHLEPEWNGLKLVAAPRYVPVDLRTLPVPTDAGTGRTGRVRSEDGAASDHASAICGAVDAELVRSARLAVAWSGGVGRGPELLLRQLGCLVDRTAAKLGLRIDPDGDRLTLVDEGGVALDSEVVLPLVALARDARVVVKGADTSRMVDDVVAARGGSVRTTTPGELHLVDALGADGDLAGEGNGGVVVPAVGMARDALAAAAAILELMARTKRPISALAAELPRYFRRRSTVACSGEEDAWLALETVATRVGAAPVHDTEQGVLVETPDGAWGLVRRSATEPVLRVTVEAPTERAADALHAELRAALPVGTAES